MKKVIFLTILVSIFLIMGCGDDDVVRVDEEIRVVLIPDTTITVYYDEPFQFELHVWVTQDTTVKWYVNDVEGGNDSLGTIDSLGRYINEQYDDSTLDEVIVKVVSQADTTRSDSILVIIKDRYYVYVDSAGGSDSSGKGTKANPYRTIYQGLEDAIQGQRVSVGPGTYNENGGEIFPLVPTYEIGVRGTSVAETIVQPPSDTSAFRLEFENSSIELLTIRGDNKQGIGIEYAAAAGIDSLIVEDITIENVHTAAIQRSEEVGINIVFSDNSVSDCVYGIVIDDPCRDLQIDRTTFMDIDSIAIYLIDPVTHNVDFNETVVDGAWIGFLISEGSRSLFQEGSFANIDSIAVLNYGFANLQTAVGGTDFSTVTTWCVYNESPDTVHAIGNYWPPGDSATIDTLYLYDDDEDPASGPVIFTQ